MIFRMNIDDFINNKIESIDIGPPVWEKFDRKILKRQQWSIDGGNSMTEIVFSSWGGEIIETRGNGTQNQASIKQLDLPEYFKQGAVSLE